MPGTRREIIGKIIGWASRPFDGHSQSRTSNVYWLYGIPGLGKTAVANSICHELHKSRILGGSYFCRCDDPILGDPGHVLPTLVYRLAWMWPPYRKLVVQEIRSDPQLNPYASSNELLAKLLNRLEKQPPHPLVFVIDAIEECGDPKARRSILKALNEACSVTRWLRIIITSRPEQDIDTFFHTTNVYTPFLSQDLGNDNHSGEDIKLFAQKRMESISESRRVPKYWPDSDLIHELVEKSDHLFIYIETLYLLIKDSENPSGLLTKILMESSGRGMSGLFRLYSNVLESMAIQEKEALRFTIGAILVVAPYRPLCDEALARLLGIEDHVLLNQVDMLSSLFYRDKSMNGGIRVRHLSILEFLTGSSCPAQYRIDIEQANMKVGYACLKTMNKELRFNICDLETSLVSNNEVRSLDDRIQEHISDSLQYSCLHWADHICSTSNHQIQVSACPLIDEFFEGIRPLFWMEVLSVMKRIPGGILALRRVLTSSQVRIIHISRIN
jgi:hypothetical protein